MHSSTPDSIRAGFEMLELGAGSLPSYSSAKNLAKTFKRCSILEYKSISYSSDSADSTEVEIKR
jgi:hypothetical protein